MADPSRTASVGDGLDGLKRVGLPASAHQRPGAPADLDLAGPVSGTVTDTTAALSFGLLDELALLVGSVECAVDVSVTSFDETTMEATWETNEACQMPFVDQGTLSFMRQ